MQAKLASKRAIVGDAKRRAAGGWAMGNIVGEPNAREQSKAIVVMTITYLRDRRARKQQNNTSISQKSNNTQVKKEVQLRCERAAYVCNDKRKKVKG
jgi:hypothetical protein